MHDAQPVARESINALRRGLDVLSAVQQASAITYTELQERTGLPKATLVRILTTLVESGWVSRHPSSNRYSAIARPGALSSLTGTHGRLVEIAGPYLARAQELIPWPVDLAVRSGTTMLILESMAPTGLGLAPDYRRLGSRPSMLRSSVGRCHLAFCPDAEREDLLHQLKRSTDPVDRQLAQSQGTVRALLQSRAQGYAFRDTMQAPSGSAERFGAVGVPLFLRSRLTACLSISWLPQFSSAEAIVKQYLKPLQFAAEQIGNDRELETAFLPS